MVLSPGYEKAELDRAQKVDGTWPAMRVKKVRWVRVLREVLQAVSWAAEQVLPDRQEG